MQASLRLQPTFDVSKLVADLAAAEEAGKYHLHWTDYHDGGWSAIPLVAVDGRSDRDALRLRSGNYGRTPILDVCPYFAEIIESFQCFKQRVRLMRLEPGANILEHVDSGESWALGQVRLHIPIVTHEEVYFCLAGQRLIMRPGELWYCDFSRPHWVQNRSSIHRVHLVLDLKRNAWMEKLFPEETFAERLGNWGHWCRFHVTEIARGVARGVGLAKLRQMFRRKRVPNPAANGIAGK